MQDTAKAVAVYDSNQLIGYILELKPGLWVPLGIGGATLSGPTHERDARDIVRLIFDQNHPAS